MDVDKQNGEGLVDATEDKLISNDTSTSTKVGIKSVKKEFSLSKSIPVGGTLETRGEGQLEGPSREAIANAMEIMRSAGSTPSKLEQLLTAGTDRRSSRRGESAEPIIPNSNPPVAANATSSPSSSAVKGAEDRARPASLTLAASSSPLADQGSGDERIKPLRVVIPRICLKLQRDATKPAGVDGEDEANSSASVESTPGSYRNPRKRLMNGPANSTGEHQAAHEKKSTEEGANKRFAKMKWKSDASSSKGESSTAHDNCPPASLKVAPIRLKKYYPSAVQSAEFEEFLVSVSEDQEEGGTSTNDGEGGTAKPKLGQEHLRREGIDTAQIDKLLSMPSPQTWKKNKAPRRQRRFMCKECPKSYSTEDDLRSHSRTHSKSKDGGGKEFTCDYCEKEFNWVASLRVHMKRDHNKVLSQNGVAPKENGTEPEGRNVNMDRKAVEPEMSSVKSEEEEEEEEATSNANETEELETSEAASRKTDSASTAGSSDVAKNGMEKESHDRDKSLPLPPHRLHTHRIARLPFRKSTGAAAPSSAPVIKKKHLSKAKLKKVSKMKSVIPQVKVKEEKEVEPEVPLTPSTGRSALRRTIQRPKWLTDTDLVTDYEFPRGTNSMRVGNSATSSSQSTTTSSSTSSPNTSIAKAGRSETRRSTSVEAAPNEKQMAATAAGDTKKGKLISRPSRESIRKEQPTQERKSPPKKSKVSEAMKGVHKVKAVPKPATPSSSTSKSKSIPNTKQKEKKPNAVPPPQSNSQEAGSSSSPTKQLQDQILSLSLSTIAENSPGNKNIRKRVSSDVASVTSNQSKKDEKRIKRSDSNGRVPEAKSLAVLKPKTPKRDKKAGSKSTKEKAKATPSDTAERSPTVLRMEMKEMGKKFRSMSAKECQGSYKHGKNIIPPISIAEETTKKGSTSASIKDDCGGVGDRADGNKLGKSGVGMAEVKGDNDVQENASGSENVHDGEAVNTQDNAEQEQDRVQSSRNAKLARDTTTFSALANMIVDPPISPATAQEHSPPEKALESGGSSSLKQEDGLEPSELRTGATDTSGNSSTSLSTASECISPSSNDEGMPVLKPEGMGSASPARGSRTEIPSSSVSSSRQLKRINEEERNNSNHSSGNPFEAPVLSMEFGSTPKNCAGVEDIEEDGGSGGSLVIDLNADGRDDDLDMNDLDDGLPLVDDDDNVVIGGSRRRDRSDSMSIRSCESGTPSEKLKALDDTNTNCSTKDKLETNDNVLSDNECLESDNDSDSNDTLMSEFSELAAQVSEKTDAAKFKEDCLRFISTKISANSMWSIRKELKRLKQDKNYFKFGKLSPLAAGLMHDIFCQSLE